MFTFPIPSWKTKTTKKKIVIFLQQKVCFFFSPFLANFHSCSFYEREKDKKIQSTKDKSDDDPREGGEWGGGPLVVVSEKFCLIVSSQDPPTTPPPHIVQVIQVKDVRMFPSMNKWQREREREERNKLLSSFDSDKMSLGIKSQHSTTKMVKKRY